MLRMCGSRGLLGRCAAASAPSRTVHYGPGEPGIKPPFESHPGVMCGSAERLAVGRALRGCNHSHHEGHQCAEPALSTVSSRSWLKRHRPALAARCVQRKPAGEWLPQPGTALTHRTGRRLASERSAFRDDLVRRVPPEGARAPVHLSGSAVMGLGQ